MWRDVLQPEAATLDVGYKPRIQFLNDRFTAWQYEKPMEYQ
jgi:hypothetical protein